MRATSNTSCGQYMMGHCWWGGNLSYLGTFKHIYRGCNDVAHCMPYTLASWDCQQRTEALCQKGRLGTVQSSHKNVSRARRRRSRSSSRHHSRMPSHRDWSRYFCCSPSNMPPRCHCGAPLSPSSNTMPKLSSGHEHPGLCLI